MWLLNSFWRHFWISVVSLSQTSLHRRSTVGLQSGGNASPTESSPLRGVGGVSGLGPGYHQYGDCPLFWSFIILTTQSSHKWPSVWQYTHQSLSSTAVSFHAIHFSYVVYDLVLCRPSFFMLPFILLNLFYAIRVYKICIFLFPHD